jgi:uncharacterized protein
LANNRLKAADIAKMKYVSLATFRKSGVAVETAVWIAEHNGTLYLYSEGHVGKVKRIRANGKARLAECDLRGKVLGEFVEASGRLVEDETEREHAFAALKAKYGWQMGLANMLSRIFGKYSKRVVIAIELT